VSRRWVGSHGPAGRGLLLGQSSKHLEHGPGKTEGHVPVEMCMPVDHWSCRPEVHGPGEIVQACAGLRGMTQRRSCMPVDCWLGRPYGCSPVR
jgi:hypothetical protein